MKKFLFTGLLLINYFAFSQVGIGTTNINNAALLQLESTSKAFVLPRMSQTNMTNIVAPVNGDLVFNNNEDNVYLKDNQGWESFEVSSCPSILLYFKDGTFPTSNTADYFLKVDNTNVVSNSSSYFEVVSQGNIKILKEGVYLINAALSTKNLPVGNRNINFFVNLNGLLIGTLSRTNFNFPINTFWGVSGSLMYKFRVNDIVSVKYLLSAGGSSSLNNAFQTLSIIKIN